MPDNSGQFRPQQKPDVPDVNAGRVRSPRIRQRLIDDKAGFDAFVDNTHRATGLKPEQVAHDYWLIRALSGVAEALPANGIFRAALTDKDKKKGLTEETRPLKGVWAFGGGTSLTSAWKISPRWSEDIDATIFRTADSSNASFKSIRRRVTEMMADVVGGKGDTSGTKTIEHTEFTVSETVDFKVDHVVETVPHEQLVSLGSVTGLIARCSDDPDGLCEEFPELGGFTLPVIEPAYIAVNKLDALHRRAATERWAGLAGRFRDIYDLYQIAERQSHADLCRKNVSQWWHQMNRGGGPVVDRPDKGYGTSPIFEPGSPAHETLRDAYNTRINTIAIGRAPSFEEAVKAAQTLDLP